ncbi:MAG: AAA family ATPase [Armatimonadetes bacterium]|nr:AAA family ATPase [Armatimonadota bacterium]
MKRATAPPTSLVANLLRNPEAFPHPAPRLEVLETHISWIVLTGDYAYKIKKPLDLGFLDFSTLEKRRRCCFEEIRLNSRTAPELYLEVVSLRGTRERPRIGGSGPVLDYAVKMREFPQAGLLDRQLSAGTLDRGKIDRVAALVADLHQRVEKAPPGSVYGTPTHVHAPVRENFDQMKSLVNRLEQLRVLRAWSEKEFIRLAPLIEQRQTGGFVRECHGDLHLGNIAENDGRIFLFDAIEFNPDLRWTDVQNEVAFLFSDLDHRGRTDLGSRFLNLYLESIGDYQGLALFRYYTLYRIMVRAKVASIRLAQSGERALERELDRYLAQAQRFIAPWRPRLVLTRGLSGSGKTHTTGELMEQLGGIRIRSDIERKRLFSLALSESSDSALGAGIYSAHANLRTYRKLEQLAENVLRSGFTVFVDAAFLEEERIAPFRNLAYRLGAPAVILDLRVDPGVLRRRVEKRGRRGADASEAGLEVLEAQLERYRPLAGPDVVPVLDATPIPELVRRLVDKFDTQSILLPALGTRCTERSHDDRARG